MNPHAKHTAPPAWLSLATGTLKAVQHRKSPRQNFYGTDDDPIADMLGELEHVPPMVDLSAEWAVQNSKDGNAFCAKRVARIGTTFELITMLRLAATFRDHDAAYALCDPAAITVLDVGRPKPSRPVKVPRAGASVASTLPAAKRHMPKAAPAPRPPATQSPPRSAPVAAVGRPPRSAHSSAVC